MAASDSDLIRDLEQRRKGMDTEYSVWEPAFREIRDAIQPSRGRFSLGEAKNRQTINKKIIDSSARKALRTLRSGLMSGMTSPSRPWFKLGLYDDDAMNDPEVKAWLHVGQARMYTILRGSNIYRTLSNCYADLGLYGTFGGLMRSHFDNVVHSYAFPMGLYRLDENEEGVVDRLHWDVKMTVRQLVERFGEDQVSDRVRNMFKANRLSDTVDVRAAVEVRLERDPMSPTARNMPMAMYYWERGVTDKLLMNSGLGTNGILAPRWEPVMGDAWSVSSPGMDAVGDALQLQMQHRDKAMAVQMSYNPPMQGPAGSKQLAYRAVPGRMHTVSAADIQKGGLRPTHDVRLDLGHLREDILETQRRVSEAFFEPLFLMASQYGVEGVKNVTATAIAEMHEEKLIALGPVLEALDHSLLTPIVENTFFYMQEAGLMPPPPERLEGAPVKVEFISLLAQAQKAVGVAAIERTIGFVGTLAQLNPNALDKLDADAAIDEFVSQVGPPPAIITTNEQARKAREARAQAQQQKAMVEAAQPMANAAKLLSEANARGAAAVEGEGL